MFVDALLSDLDGLSYIGFSKQNSDQPTLQYKIEGLSEGYQQVEQHFQA